MFTRFTTILVSTLFFIVINQVYAESFDSFQDFKEYVEKFVTEHISEPDKERVEVQIIKIDEKILLPACPSLLKAALSQGDVISSSNSVLLECTEKPGWKMYVPVQLRIMMDAVTAARKIMPMERLSENDLIMKKQDKFQVCDSYYESIEDVAGQISAQLILPGHVICKKNIKQIPLIKKNQNVMILLRHGAIEITMNGIAKSDGFLNDKVKIMNASSKKIVEAKVKGEQLAEINY